jgi:hypothetical protein
MVKYYTKTLLKLLVTDIGAIVFISLYLIAGAFLFQYTEQYTEKLNCQTGEAKENQLIHKYRSIMVNYLLFNYKNIESDTLIASSEPTTTLNSSDINEILVTNILYQLRNSVLEIRKQYKYYGQNCNEVTLWTFSSALLFTITLVTTIGKRIN